MRVVISDTQPLEWVGRRYGDLTVIASAPPSASGKHRWLCRCQCGTTKILQQDNLCGGHTKSCGCLRVALVRERNVKNSPSRKYVDSTTSARNTVITNYRKAAKTRGLEWALTTTECESLFRSTCTYCGAPPSNICQMYGGTRKPLPPFVYNGIDRVDSFIGYTRQNTVACCMVCNRAKHQMSVLDFKIWVLRVYNTMYPSVTPPQPC